MTRLCADLHIHTVLSPCASRDMRPPAIVRAAAQLGIEVIAVCDHNSAGNAAAVAAAAAALPGGPLVIPGMEITTAEEVHVLGLFPDAAAATAAGEEVASGLPGWRPLLAAGTSRPREPEQELVDAEGRTIGVERRMLAAASPFTLAEVVDLIHRHGGLAVAAHMDRRSFSVPGQLGFLPPDVPFDGLEISAAGARRGRGAEWAARALPFLSSSDSHFLQDIGTGLTVLTVQRPCFEEIRAALRGLEGRSCGIA
jgi:3',5'-nucleoside bisphosphate phosphatase